MFDDEDEEDDDVQSDQIWMYMGEMQIYPTKDSEYPETVLIYKRLDDILKDLSDFIDEQRK